MLWPLVVKRTQTSLSFFRLFAPWLSLDGSGRVRRSEAGSEDSIVAPKEGGGSWGGGVWAGAAAAALEGAGRRGESLPRIGPRGQSAPGRGGLG